MDPSSMVGYKSATPINRSPMSPLSEFIDAHQHFWRYDPVAYDWIDESMRAIRRDFLPADLAPLITACGVAGSVAVQARQSLAETDWLLDLAAAHPNLVRGVVGWVPLRDHGSAIEEILDTYAGRRALKGVRHVLQGEPDDYFSAPSFHAGLERLAPRGLTYDLLIFARQLPLGIALVDRHPNLPVVLDHIAKPVVSGPPPKAWINDLRTLARRDHVMCKFSGVVTEVPGWAWTPALLRPYFDTVLEIFGPRRLMFGSDWPVCQVAAHYLNWHQFVAECVSPLSTDERAAILGGNATRFYNLSSA